MERLYTERQWRAIARIEELTDLQEYGEVRCLKRLIGPSFSDGEFWVCAGFGWRAPTVMGPHRPNFFFVKEVHSETRIVGEADSIAEAVSAAQKRIASVGPECMAELIESGLAWVAEQEAERLKRIADKEAKEASRRDAKEKKLGKRARAVFAASEGKCHYCATELDLFGKWHIEHKFPRALFGGSEQSNLVASCAPCNHRKKDKTDLEFLALIQRAQTAQSSVGDVLPLVPDSLISHTAEFSPREPLNTTQQF